MEETEKKEKPVSLVEQPTQFGLFFKTPDGNLAQEEFLVWMGNLLLELKEGMIGK